MPEELLHEREYTRTGIAPRGSRLLQEMASMADSAHEEEAAVGKQGSDAELGRSGAQNGHAHSGDMVAVLASALVSHVCLSDGTQRPREYLLLQYTEVFFILRRYCCHL